MPVNAEVAPWPFPGSLPGDEEVAVVFSSLQGRATTLSSPLPVVLCFVPKATVESHRIMESLGLEKISETITSSL